MVIAQQKAVDSDIFTWCSLLAVATHNSLYVCSLHVSKYVDL